MQAERIREAAALATQAMCYAELGDLANGERVARQAIAKSPGVPTRYLYALAQVQLAKGRLAEARATGTEILKGALPADNPDRTEDKAAAYIRGLAFLKEGKPQEARDEFSRAVSLSGYEYSVYRLGLARAYLQTAAHADALASVKQAAAPAPDPLKPRLDLQLDRVRAGLIEAEIDKAMGRGADAAALAKTFLEAWKRADANVADVGQARRLAGLP